MHSKVAATTCKVSMSACKGAKTVQGTKELVMHSKLVLIGFTLPKTISCFNKSKAAIVGACKKVAYSVEKELLLL